MSRIGKSPISLNKQINIKLEGNQIQIKGPKGKLSYLLPQEIKVEHKGNELRLYKTNESRIARQSYGLSRTIINNMVRGVSQGFSKTLEIQGVGYRAQVDGDNLMLSVGYSHLIHIKSPPGINIKVNNNTNIEVSGICKETVGQISAQIRSIRPPEPYKGKGIRYCNETIRRKVGKAGK